MKYLICYFKNSSRNWNTPITMDLKGGLVILIQQAERCAS